MTNEIDSLFAAIRDGDVNAGAKLAALYLPRIEKAVKELIKAIPDAASYRDEIADYASALIVNIVVSLEEKPTEVKSLGDCLNRTIDRAPLSFFYKAMAEGRPLAARFLMESFLPTIKAAVESFVDRKPTASHMSDDLFAAGSLSLVEAVRSIEAKDDVGKIDDISGYLTKAVNRSFALLVDDDAIIGPSHIERKRMAAAGEPYSPPATCDIEELSPQEQSDGVKSLRESVEACCESEFDRQLVELRGAGFTIAECADALGKSYATAQRALRRIESRFDQSNLALGA